MSRPFLRRLAIVFAASAVLSGIGGAHAEEVLRIGFQKSSTLLTLIRSQGTFERELARQGIRVSWHEFPSGLPLLESLNVGNVDLSADVADTVPVFAQAAGARLTYFARETPSPAAQAILVGEHSPLKSLAELKGKRIAVTKAAGSHYLLIAALASAGLEFSDIQPAYLTPADVPRRLRERQGRRLGDLGPLRGKRPAPATRAGTGRRPGPGQLPALLPRLQRLRQETS